MNINKLGLALVVIFSGWCLYQSFGNQSTWNDYMVTATVAVIIAGVFVFNLGRDRGGSGQDVGKDHRDDRS